MTIPHKKKSNPTYKSETFAVKLFKTEQGLVARIQADKFYRHFINTHGKEGQEGTIKLTLLKPKRTTLQNNFYWVYLDLISMSSGHSPEELHIWAKGKFLSKGITEVFGDKVRKVESSTELNRSEFTEYLARIELTTGIPIPNPEPFNLGITWEEYRKIKEDQRRKYANMKPKGLGDV